LWTTFALLISFCNKFWSVLVTRIAFAVFMSADVPISVSLICDYALPSERGRA
jgi:MFS family permease